MTGEQARTRGAAPLAGLALLEPRCWPLVPTRIARTTDILSYRHSMVTVSGTREHNVTANAKIAP
jgi:hypothetical protein